MSDDELDKALAELEEARKSAQKELEALKHHRERIKELERDKEALLDYYKGVAPGHWTRSRPRSGTASISWCGFR